MKYTLPRRKSRTAGIIAISLVCLLLIAAGIFAAVKWQSIGYVLNPGDISPANPEIIRAELHSREIRVISENENEILYSAYDDTMELKASLATDRLYGLEVSFNLAKAPVYTVQDGISAGYDLLSPYLTEPEIEALAFILTRDMLSSLLDDKVNYSRKFGEYTLEVKGDIVSNDVKARYIYTGLD